MKWLLLASICWSLWVVSPCFGASDKLLHYSISAPMGAAGTYAVDHAFPQASDATKVAGGVAIASFFGAFKEVADEEFSTADLMADITGALTGALIYQYWDRLPSPKLEHLNLTIEAAPPHNEPVVGDRVARYRAQLNSEVHWWRLVWSPKLTAWGVNQWRTSDTVGHGIPEAWEGSDWSVEEWRFSTTQNLDLHLTDYVYLTTEYYLPFQRETWGKNPSMRNYYWLTGFRFGW